MPKPEIEEFARILVKQVRDRAIGNCDRNLAAGARSITALKWREAGVAAGPQTNVLIPACVDAALFFLLNAVDEGILRLQYTTGEGKVVDLTSEGLGELGGWYMGGHEGWRAQYSKERRADDVDDLDGPAA